MFAKKFSDTVLFHGQSNQPPNQQPSGRVGGRPRYEDVPACRPVTAAGRRQISLIASAPPFFVRQTQLRAKCSEPVRPRAESHRLPASLPSRQVVEIFSAIRMRKKYYLLAGCLDRACLAGYNPVGDGRANCLLLFRSHPARRRGYRSTGQAWSVQVGRVEGIKLRYPDLQPLHPRASFEAIPG